MNFGIDYGKDYTYADSRLSDSIVLYEGRPVWVICVTCDGEVEFRSISDSFESTAPLEEFDLNPFKLGYCNLTAANGMNNSVLLSRSSARHYKQGLRRQNLICVGSSPSKILGTKAFEDTVMGKYPSLSNCIDQLCNEEAKSIAFSRNFSLVHLDNKQACLHYRKVSVGRVKLDSGEVSLNKDFDFLDGMLEEDL